MVHLNPNRVIFVLYALDDFYNVFNNIYTPK